MPTTPESIALSKDLKKRGWSFVGPTTVYAFMQAMGLVNDHLDGCLVPRGGGEAQEGIHAAGVRGGGHAVASPTLLSSGEQRGAVRGKGTQRTLHASLTGFLHRRRSRPGTTGREERSEGIDRHGGVRR